MVNKITTPPTQNEVISKINELIDDKQDTLVSGTNIKTINNIPILGSGNIDIQGGGSITVDSYLSTTSTNPVQNKVITSALNGKLDGFTLRFAGTWSGGVHAVNFVTIDYSECNSENGVFIKFSMVNSHGNGQAGRFLQDVVLNVKYTGEVAGTLYRYFAVPIDSPSSEYYGSHYYGDVFWVNDTTNKIVRFYVLMHQYSYTSQSPYFRLNASTKGVITQSTGGTGASEYSSGTRVWTTVNWFETDQTYSATSAKPQSGVAIASAISGKADDSAVVHKAGTETITGFKTLSAGAKITTTQSGAILELESAASGTNFLIRRTNGTTCVVESGNSIGLFGTYSNHPLQIRTNYVNRMEFGTNGSVTLATAPSENSNDNQIATTAWTNSKIPTVNNATLTIQKNGSNVATFTANASSNVTANISVPNVTDIYSATSSDGMSGIAVKSAIDSAISSVYKPAGSISFSSLPEPSSSNTGYVYNITDSFTTDSRFIEGSGKTYPAGTNIVIIESVVSLASTLYADYSQGTSTNLKECSFPPESVSSNTISDSENGWTCYEIGSMDSSAITFSKSAIWSVGWEVYEGGPTFNRYTAGDREISGTQYYCWTTSDVDYPWVYTTTPNPSTTQIGYFFDVLSGIVDLSNYVPVSRTINGKALSNNISLTASDVGALPSSSVEEYTSAEVETLWNSI